MSVKVLSMTYGVELSTEFMPDVLANMIKIFKSKLREQCDVLGVELVRSTHDVDNSTLILVFDVIDIATFAGQYRISALINRLVRPLIR